MDDGVIGTILIAHLEAFGSGEQKTNFQLCTFIWRHGLREAQWLSVECLTRDREAAGSSLTALWSLSKTH